MKEEDIRQDETVKEVMRLYAIDQQNLLQKESQFVEVDCPACAAPERTFAWKRDGFSFHECQHCKTIYVSPRPTAELLNEYYRMSQSEAYWTEHVYSASDDARVRYIIRPRVAKLAEYLQRFGNMGTGTLVDIGAGYGSFAKEVQDQKLVGEVIAIEANPVPAAECEKKGLKVINSFIEGVEGLQADVITCFELIEHLFRPQDFVLQVAGALDDGGLFVLSTPNMAGFDLMLLRDKSDNATAPDHINYFNPESLTLLLQNNGFEVLDIATPGRLDAELVRKKTLAGEYSLEGQAFLQTVLIDKWEQLGEAFQDFLADNGLSSHLWMVARKSPAK